MQQHGSFGDRGNVTALDVGVDQFTHRRINGADRLGLAGDLGVGGAEGRDGRQFRQDGQLVGKGRGEALEALVGDVEVGGDRCTECLAQTCLHRCRDDCNRADKRKADHERRCSRCGTTGLPLCISTGDAPRGLAVHRATGNGEKVADDSADGCCDRLREACHAEEDENRADCCAEQRACGTAGLCEQSDDEKDDTDTKGGAREHEALVALEA